MAVQPTPRRGGKIIVLGIRLNDEQNRLVQKAADAKSLPLSTWARSELLALAKKAVAKGEAAA